MKELEKMKELWKEVHENNNNYTQLNNNQIMESLSKKSNSVFSKLQRSVKLEIYSVVFGIPIILWSAFKSQSVDFQTWAIVFCTMGILLTGIFWNDYRKIQGYSSNIANLRGQLSDAILQLDQFIKLYFKIPLLLTPVFASIYIVFTKPNILNNKLIFIVCILVIILLSYFIQKWYTELMYGKYLKELKKLKSELELEA